ncbi:MAG: cell division topological specificity factor MinE [Oceanococcaceae bacterium]
MSWLTELFRERNKQSANTAKERLKLVVVHDRNRAKGGPSFLPELQKDILKVIRRYVQVPDSAVQIDVQRDDNTEALEVTISLPERPTEAQAGSKSRAAH